jgi:hypothetical protein
MLQNVNDSLSDAKQLGQLLSGEGLSQGVRAAALAFPAAMHFDRERTMCCCLMQQTGCYLTNLFV